MNLKNSSQEKILIGLTGPAGAGKDTVANYLVEKYGFQHISTGDLLREYIQETTGQEPNRDNMRLAGRELRAKYGADFLVSRALTESNSPRLVISGLRALNEARAISDHGGVIVICDAPSDLRFKRTRQRGRIGDEITLEQFRAQEAAEAENSDPNSQNISAIMEMADQSVNNAGQLEELHSQIDDLIKLLKPITN